MRKITVEDFQENIEVIVDDIVAGDIFVITSDGKNVAVMTSYEDYEILTGVSLEIDD